MAYGIINADQMQSSVSGVSLGAGNATSFKNRIINGAMVINQYGVTTSTTNSGGTYVVDRWNISSTQNLATIGQNYGGVTPPAGFNNYYGLKITTTGTLGVNDYNQLIQTIEGYNVADLAWGTANAKPITVSFWVYSSTIGTWGGSIRNSALSRSYPFTYTINVANTWEQKSITIAGDTTGTWLTTNGIGMYFTLSYGAGSTYSGTAGAWAATNYNSATGATSIVATSNATFYFTGVQLEVGSFATGFDYRSYGTELVLCQRYFQNFVPSTQEWIYNETTGNNTNKFWQSYNIVTMRASPSTNYSGAWYPVSAPNGGGTISLISTLASTVSRVSSRVTVSSGNTCPTNGVFHCDAWNGLNLQLSAEL